LSSEHFGFDKNLGPGNGTVHMGFGRKVNDGIHFFLCKESCHQRCIADIAPYKPVTRNAVHPFQILKISRIGKQVEVDYPASGIPRHEAVDEIGPDKTGATGNEYRFQLEAALHMLTSMICVYKSQIG